MKPETSFRVNHVDPFLKTLKNSFFDAIQQTGKSGSPDYYGCCMGLFVALEIKKSHREELSLIQEYVCKRIIKTYGYFLVVSPENWEYIKILLTRLDGGN